MCREGWCESSELEGGCLHEGGENYQKYLKKGSDRIEGRRNKYFKKCDKLVQGVGALKWGGGRGAGIPCKLRLLYIMNFKIIKFFDLAAFFSRFPLTFLAHFNIML